MSSRSRAAETRRVTDARSITSNLITGALATLLALAAASAARDNAS
ncbi:SPW repeat protein, partial [Streptomyces sp. NPDC005877]